MYAIEVRWIGGEQRFVGYGSVALATGVKLHLTPHKNDAIQFVSYLKAEEKLFELELDGEAEIITL